MSNISKLEFLALDISGKNYLSWILDAEVHLNAASLGNTITEGNKESVENRSKAFIFLRRRFDHQKSVILPRARYEWMHVHLQDFKSVIEYNSALYQIVFRLRLCGETVTESDLLEKTYSTFHASNMVLQQQYRERQFRTYFELISCILVAEQNNELLIQNHQTHPMGSSPIPEVNVVVSNRGGKRHGHVLGPKQFINKKCGTSSHPKKGKKDISKCRRCGTNGHWADVCRMPKQLVELYQASIKAKEVETNFAQYEVPIDNMHLDLPDFKANANNNEFEDIDSCINDV
ncbi:hypothetical protein RND81_02G072500 [Saponaria officinalis]|uniref:CCHC-type domain-containing protein n=1 Tax=Saponaria officinalis TaxID=3572 RepID=A0AAW1MRX4_SAPOF